MHTSTISTATIIKNEKRHIKPLLENLADFADEVVIVDTGSTDGTLEALRSMEGKYPRLKIFEYKYEGIFHYGKAKNFSIKQATGDYVVVIDADERLSDGFKSALREFLKCKQPMVAKVKRVDKVLPHFVEYIDRIIKNGEGITYREDERGMVHEELTYSDDEAVFNEVLWHDKGREHHVFNPKNGRFQLELQIARTPKKKSTFGHILRGVWYFWYRFKKLYVDRGLYKDGWLGFKYSLIRGWDGFLVQYYVGRKDR